MSKSKQQIKFEADVSNFKTNIEKAQSSIKTLNNELKLNQSQLKGNKEDVNLLSQRITTLKEKYEEQSKVVENTRKSYEKAVEIFGENSKEAENLKNKLLQAETAEQNIKNEIDKANKELEEQTNKLITTSKKWQESGEAIKDFGSKIDSVGNKLSIVSGLVAGIAVASLKASIDFESAFTGVTKTVDGTEEQLQELRKGILDMSTELPSTASEISAVAEAAGQLGIQTDNVLDFTRVMIDLGNSTNVTADEAASALAKFANVTKMSADDYSKLGSTIVALGNNYATTEADIISMGQNLASAGTQVGMSQSDIMALATALSSVGLEAQAGGTAFSKALVSMQLAVETNSKDLKNWADVAGMSTKEFSRLFKEDATSALQAFIKGLSECGGETESAIKVLDDMGITETRMRDALLRSANASDTFSGAIELGSKAWKENTALAEEANKRYGTTESQLTMLKNEVQKTAIEFGDELAPSLRQIVKDAKPLLNSISSAVKTFANLDDKTKKHILTLGKYLVLLGPATKTVGSLVKTYGSLKTTLGTVSGAFAVLQGKTENASDSSKKLADLLKSSFSPTGIATLALVAGMAIIATEIGKATAESKKYAEECEKVSKKAEEERKSIEELRASIDSNVQVDLDNIDRTKRLWEELEKITDENGKVKEGYENRAKVITGQLSEALGTEVTMTDNVIDKYKELQSEIDTLILKKKGEAILSGYEEKRDKALSERSQKQQELLDLEEELVSAQERFDEADKNLTDMSNVFKPGGSEKAVAEYNNAKKALEDLKSAYENTDKIVSQYTKDIENYDYALGLYTEGSSESIQKMVDDVGKTYTKNGETVKTTYKELIQEQTRYLNDAKTRYDEAIKNNDEAEKKKSQTTIDESNRRLHVLAQELVGQTSLIGENSEDVKESWRTLATDSYDVYQEELSNLGPEMQAKIQEITGVVMNGTPTFTSVMQKLAQEGVDALDKDAEFKQKALESLSGYLEGLTNEEKRLLLKTAGIDNAEEVMKGLEEGNLSEDEGIKILTGLKNGLGNTQFQDDLFSKARGIANKLTNLFSIKTTISTVSTSSSVDGSHKDGLDYVPYDNYIARLHKGERVLTADENKQYMADNIENKISNRNIVVQFYPQSMTEDELQRAENYIAKKWGMAL